jgi:curved DNA-binding protein CbpA
MKNPFDIFQISPTFDVDLSELTKHYQILVTSHHPDKGGDAIIMEDINRAYSILKNPIQRARALVEFHGIQIADEETLTDPVILDEIFELRIKGDKNLIGQKQQEALTMFKEATVSGNVTVMRQAYWRLLCLDRF